MHAEHRVISRRVLVCAVVGSFLAAWLGASPVLGQANSPSATQKTQTVIRRQDKPEISQISPDSVPAGWIGRLVLTGKNLSPGMAVNIGCFGAELVPKNLKVESPTRAVADVAVPDDVNEHACQVYVGFERQPASFRVFRGGQPEIGPSAYPTPELAQITPNSASRGWSGEVELGGKNFNPRMLLRIACRGGVFGVSATKLEVKNPERAVAQMSIPNDWEAGRCEAYVGAGSRVAFTISGPASPAAAARESPAGRTSGQVASGARKPLTEPVARAAGAPGSAPSSEFAIVEAPVTLVGEGAMPFMDVLTRIQKGLMSGGGKDALRKGYLLLTYDSVRFVQDGNAVFEEPSSTVKAVESISMMGQPTGFFRIAFTDGKIYNFQDPKGKSPQNSSYAIIKKRLGK